MTAGNRIVSTNVVFVGDATPIQDVVQLMVEKGISSVLVADQHDHVVGIVTERDIVRKFTLLDVADKLTRLVSTVMSRPVAFAALGSIEEDIAKLHVERKLRHFPVLSGAEPTKANVVGMISVTDLLRQYLLDRAHAAAAAKDAAPAPRAPSRVLCVLAKTAMIAEPYLRVFASMGLKTHYTADVNELANHPDDAAVLFDMDAYFPRELQSTLVVARRLDRDLVMATSNLALVAGLQRFLKAHHVVMAKPVDFSYCHWLFTQRWHKQHVA